LEGFQLSKVSEGEKNNNLKFKKKKKKENFQNCVDIWFHLIVQLKIEKDDKRK